MDDSSKTNLPRGCSSQTWTDLGLGPMWRLREQNNELDAASALAENRQNFVENNDTPQSSTFNYGTAERFSKGSENSEGVYIDPSFPVDPSIELVEPLPVAGSRYDMRTMWLRLHAQIHGCTACGLHRTRKQAVPGVGYHHADWMLIGEAPGAEEDARGEPFVGQAGRLLDNMLRAIRLSRDGRTEDSVFIANVLKCRPPGNRNPEPDEVAACERYLLRQIALVQPKVIILLGRFAAQAVLKTSEPISALRGKVHQTYVQPLSYGDRGLVEPMNPGRPVPVIVTYHPAYLLRNLPDKAKSWADLCFAHQVMQTQRAQSEMSISAMAAADVARSLTDE
ncbi:uracil-DNA glycosylase [Ampullimonas aquatilis]|uniref:uracil-DNA glycosylase n=1 Tax=Ampullimonas aquatilis TaxID=1341549 RepID=UPI003C75EC4D